MKTKRCASCRCKFYPNPSVPTQKYCSRKQCQRSRKNRWNLRKLKLDNDYKITKAAAQHKWRIKNRRNKTSQLNTKADCDIQDAINISKQAKKSQLMAEQPTKEPTFNIFITTEMLTRLIYKKTIACKLILA
jgi:hypothetical protein